MMRRWWLVALGALVVSGCVPLPVGLPPLRAGVGIQAVEKVDPKDDVLLSGQLDIGLFPWQLVPDYIARSMDFGLGYRSTFGEAGRSLMGPYLEGAMFQHPSGEDSWRLGLHLQLQALSQAGPWRVQGAGAGVKVSAGFSTFVQEPADSCDSSGGCFFGYSYGEGGGALFVEANLGIMGGQTVWQTTFGLELRIPAVLGIALVPLF
jgi:hypothetical protein